ncbi:hypothetical protein DF186_24060, partial [Enterococcus hirae]
PLLREAPAPAPADVHAEQRAGHGVEAGREDDDVAPVLLLFRPDAAWLDLHERGRTKVDEAHVVPVESLEVVRVDRGALG